MRHLWSLLASVVIAPLAWLTMCVGQVGTAKQFGNYASSGHFKAGDFVPPLLFLAGAGLILGIIACLRFSPLGPLVAGIAYLGSYVALLIWPQRTWDTFGYTFHLSFLDGQGDGDLTTPLTTGSAALVGAILIVAVVSGKRWQRWPRPAAAVDAAPEAPSEPLAPVSPAAITSGESTATLPAVPAQPVAPFTESEPIGTVVWTREPAESTTTPLPATHDLPVAGGQPSGLGSPWDTPPGESAERSSTR
jgi:hypothetical protein